MEIITLIDSDGKERTTTKTAWKHQPEQDRLKRSGWKLKPEVDKPESGIQQVKALADQVSEEVKTKKSQKNG